MESSRPNDPRRRGKDREPSSGPDPRLPPRCPAPLRAFVIECLEGGRLLVVVLDGKGRIGWANQAFRDTVLEGKPDREVPFESLLDPGSRVLLSRLLPFAGEKVKTIELRHPISAGLLTTSYQFFPCGDGTICGIGSDRTEEKELIEQMSALIDDLHQEIARRTELSLQLEQMATTDFLTGLSNRRLFDQILEREWGRMRRYGNHFALLILDLDHFKRVNDRFGHQVGDEVLKRVAGVLSDEVRAEDVVARYGGEEFAVIALGADADRSRDLGERLRQRVARTEMPAFVEGITISIGVAATSVADPPQDIDALIARADQALYRAKAGGRNRVEVDGS